MNQKSTRKLSDLEILAVSKLVTDSAAKKARASVSPGQYEVRLTLDTLVALNVGADYDQRVVAKAEPWTLLAVALSHLNGVTVESIVKEALAADPKMVEDIKESAQRALSEIKEATWSRCQGKVTVPTRLVEAVVTDGGATLTESGPSAPAKPEKVGFDLD